MAIANGMLFPDELSGVVFLSGLSYPVFQLSFLKFAPPALPVLGSLLSHTVYQPLQRLMVPSMLKRFFAPQEIPERLLQAPPIEVLYRPLGICQAPRACYFGGMRNCKIICAMYLAPLVLAMLALTPAAAPAAAATCIFDWAVPGPYDISGDFRGRTETVTARLTNDCRVTIGLPGVFTGGPVKRAGSCLVFSFKVQDVRQTFTARWCKDTGVVPWQGRNVRAQIVPRHGRMNSPTR